MLKSVWGVHVARHVHVHACCVYLRHAASGAGSGAAGAGAAVVSLPALAANVCKYMMHIMRKSVSYCVAVFRNRGNKPSQSTTNTMSKAIAYCAQYARATYLAELVTTLLQKRREAKEVR